jgi:hypothetical protein
VDATGVLGGSGVTLLDSITIRNGISETIEGGIQVNSQDIAYRYGGGIYCVNASPYLRNVFISDNKAVLGGGMYNTGTSYPVLKSVTFTNNSASGFKNEVGEGGGFTNAGGTPFFLYCQFDNNTTVGGSGAGLYMQGGKTLVRNSRFYLNTASGAGGGIANNAETWVYKSSIESNTAYDGGNGISNGGNLYLVNTTVTSGIYNGGTLSGTKLTASGGVSSSGNLALVDSDINSLSVSQGPTVVAGGTLGGLGYTVASSESDKSTDDKLGGVILTNVTINGGITTGYGNYYDFNHGAANLLLNSVLIDGGNLTVRNTGTAYPDDRSGVYVTLNNVTIANGGQGLVTEAKSNIAVPGPGTTKYDVLDLRIRNSLIMGTEDIPTRDQWPIIGTFAAAGNLSSGSVILRKERAALLSPGDIFRVLQGSTTNPRPALYMVNNVHTDTGVVEFNFLNTTPDTSYAANDTMALSSWTSIGTIGSGVSLSNGATGALTVTSSQKVLLPLNTLFKISDSPPEAPGVFVCRVIRVYDDLNQIEYQVLGPSSAPAQNYDSGDHIMIVSGRPGFAIGSRLSTETGGNTWDLGVNAYLLLSDGETFRLSSGGSLLPVVNTVTDVVDDSIVSFTADERAAYSPADEILVANGDLTLAYSSTLDTDPHSLNRITVTPEQAEILWYWLPVPGGSAGVKFRLMDDGGNLRDSLNTLMSIDNTDPYNPLIEFTATSADDIEPSDTIMVVVDIPSTAVSSGSLADGELHIDPDLAALMHGGTKFQIEAANGTLNAAVFEVSGDPQSDGTVTFTGGTGTYTGDSRIVFPVRYTDLGGSIHWDHSMARGADKAAGPGSFISGLGKTPENVFVDPPDDYHVQDGALTNAGDDALYPLNNDAIQSLLDQCFEQYWANADIDTQNRITTMKDWLTSLFNNNLFTWSGGVLSLPTGLGGSVSITDFLSKDRGGDNRIQNGAIDIGAFED